MTKILAISFVIAGFISLSGCSFQPLHGETASGGYMKDELASIEVPILNGRVAQQVRNELLFKLTGGGHSLPAKYKLSIAVKESILNIALKNTGDAGSKIYRLDADFTLTPVGGKNSLYKGKSTARATFDKFDSTFSNIRAQRDAANRAAKVIAGDIYTRIAAILSGQG